MRQLQIGPPPVYMGNDPYLKELSEWAAGVAQTLEEYSYERDRPTNEPYSTSNVSTLRTFDADATSVSELADILGTMIEDLRGKVFK